MRCPSCGEECLEDGDWVFCPNCYRQAISLPEPEYYDGWECVECDG